MYHTPMPNLVAANIKRERELRGWSQRELAERALGGARNYSQVSRYESGVNIPSLANLQRIAAAFSLAVSDLLSDTSNEIAV